MSTIYVGIDVSAKQLEVATSSKRLKPRVFENDATGRKALAKWLGARDADIVVVLEPTGLYSLDVALGLVDMDGLQVVLPNPRAVHNFAKASMARNKDDATDAKVLVAFGQQMPIKPWISPSAATLQVRSISRAVIALGADKARLRHRLHALKATHTSPVILITELEQGLADLKARQARLRAAALELIKGDETLRVRYDLVCSLPGVAEGNAITIIGELCVLDPEMTAKQWTAHSGLDPVNHSSGSSVYRRPHISRRGNARLRQCLYLASLVAARRSPAVGRVHQRLVTRGKTRNQAHCAVMRKYLHVIHSMWKTGNEWDGSRFGA